MPRRSHGGAERGSEPDDATDHNSTGWLLDGLAIRPPLEEFRRLFEMKKRAFEGKVDAESLRKYEQARRLGEKFIAEQDYDQEKGPRGASC